MSRSFQNLVQNATARSGSVSFFRREPHALTNGRKGDGDLGARFRRERIEGWQDVRQSGSAEADEFVTSTCARFDITFDDGFDRIVRTSSNVSRGEVEEARKVEEFFATNPFTFVGFELRRGIFRGIRDVRKKQERGKRHADERWNEPE
jgi:hypothetical protein